MDEGQCAIRKNKSSFLIIFLKKLIINVRMTASMEERGRKEIIRVFLESWLHLSANQFRRLSRIGAIDTDMRDDLLLSFCRFCFCNYLMHFHCAYVIVRAIEKCHSYCMKDISLEIWHISPWEFKFDIIFFTIFQHILFKLKKKNNVLISRQFSYAQCSYH